MEKKSLEEVLDKIIWELPRRIFTTKPVEFSEVIDEGFSGKKTGQILWSI